jgi:predicted homoserine dehydrogenase-like protein
MTAERNISLDLDYLPRLPVDKSPAIGCIGAGFIMADCHLVAYRQAGFHPVAIASRRPDHARQVAERHGLAAYDSYEQMLENRICRWSISPCRRMPSSR